MRTDTVAFATKNTSRAKRPRYVIELAFDTANTILRYFTSHSDSALPGGATAILGVVEGLSGTSQTLNPDTANATIGNIDFELVDKASIVTTTLGAQLTLGRSTRRQRVRVYVGYEGLAWSDYTLVQTQLVTNISFDKGTYKFKCADIQRELRKDIFDVAKTTLQSTVSATATTIDVFNTAAFSTVAHGSSYSDAPSSTVGYIKIQDEVIRYTGKTSTQFTGCTRGVLNTRAVEHAVDTTATADRRTAVEEYIYLELPAVKLMYALLTGALYNQGGATLPPSYHLGIDPAYVRLANFTGIGADLYDPANDQNGFVVRFEGLTKTDGKKFIEQELGLPSGAFMPVYADGALGLRRMANVLHGAAYVKQLDETNVVSYDELEHDFDSLHNILQIGWNYDPSQKAFTRVDLFPDLRSITIHKQAPTQKYNFRGLHGSRHSKVTLAQLFDSYRDRYTGPPLRINVTVLPSLNTLEVGDVVRLKLDAVRDFVANGPLDRSFEIQNISINWLTGDIHLKLFASSEAPGAISATTDATALSDAWYSSQGTNLASVLTITGSNPGHVTANGNLTGNADMNAAGAIYYYTGDLQIDPGVTVTINNNDQLRVKGFFQNNGTISGKGRGIAGAAAVVGPTSPTQSNAGTVGFIGSTESGGGLLTVLRIEFPPGTVNTFDFDSFRGTTVVGANAAMPNITIAWNGSTLAGIPGDMRGSSGSSGLPFTATGPAYSAGGAGGNGGAGLAIISRGFAQGASSKIDLSGGDGAAGASVAYSPAWTASAGSGAGGAPGALLVLLDGASATASGLTEAGFVAENGKTPISGQPVSSASGAVVTQVGSYQSFFVGTGDGTSFPLPSLSGARGGLRVQSVPANTAAAADPIALVLPQPSSLSLSSGTTELLVASNGTIVVRVKATWTAVADARTAGYDFQFKRSADTDIQWQTVTVIGRTNTTAWAVSLQDGVNWDFRVRAAGGAREVSEWTTITGYFVVGKTAKPANVGALSYSSPFLSWPENSDADLAGYVLRYHVGNNTDWATATPAHTGGFITETEFDVTGLPFGEVTMLVRALDTSGNDSTTAAALLVTVTASTDPLQLAVSNWTERANPQALTLNAITWSGSLFVAVGFDDGTDAYIVTSPDGIVWTERANPKSQTLFGVAWNGTVFVAVGFLDGTDAYIVTSTNGVTWTERANPKNKTLNAVAWNGSLFVAVGKADGTDAYLITSPNGTTWTERANPLNRQLYSVAWNGTVWVAVGDPSGFAAAAYIITSPDGITWTQRTSPAPATDLITRVSVAWNGSLFVVVGTTFDGGSTVSFFCLTSPDGITWTQRSGPTEFAALGIGVGNGVSVAVGTVVTGSGLNMATSFDGIIWTRRFTPKANNLNAVAWNGLLFCAVGDNDATDAYIITSLSQ